jgi:recombination protein RecT
MPNRAGPPPVQNASVPMVVRKLDDVVKEVGQRSSQFAALLGADNVERWRTVALHALAQNKNVLQNCTTLSIVEAIRESAALGLSPTGLLGEGWILPYGDQAKFMPGYRGYLKLLRNSGQIKIADAQIVYMADEFSVRLGTEPSIHHIPTLYGEKGEDGAYLADRGDYRGAYAWVRLTSGETMIEWMSYDDIMKVAQHSAAVRSGKETPWDTDTGEMMRKTPIRRLVKRLPLESMPLVARAAVLDEEGDVIEGDATEVTPAAQTRATAAAYALTRGASDEASEAPATSDAVSGDDGPPGPPTAVAVAEPEKECGAASPYGDGQTCEKALGHEGNHRGADGSTW